MSLSASNCVAIDTNVFGHIIDKRVNNDGHIHYLLKTLRDKGFSLLADKKGMIFKEYRDHILREKFLKNPHIEVEAYLLTYWLVTEPTKVSVDCNSTLAKEIKKIIVEQNANVDRLFVHVAFKKESSLVSNDKSHIVNRREQLKVLSSKSKILFSHEAASCV